MGSRPPPGLISGFGAIFAWYPTAVDWYELEVRSLEAARAARGPLTRPTIFYGSSTFRLWRTLPQDLGCPEALNLGFGGSTLEACLHFFDRLLVPECPGSLVLYAGDNDIGDGKDPRQVFEFFQAIADKVESELGAIPFGFISIKPSPARFLLQEKIRKANALIKDHISRRKNAYYIDLFDSMLLPDKTPRTDLFEADGLHINKAGYQLWAKLLLPFRNRMFTPHSPPLKLATVSSSEE